ncbi:MAG: ATP-binding protein [Candidatus Anstonellales archaeon]
MGNINLERFFTSDFDSRQIFFSEEEPPITFLSNNPSNSIYVGRTSIFSTPFFWNPALLANPHIVILGISGSGKSYLIKTFLVRASLVWGANALILDWSGEYVPWVREVGGKIISFKEGHSLNLLDCIGEKEERITQIIDALEILTDISNYPSQKRITEKAFRQAYKCSKNRVPTIADVFDHLHFFLKKAKSEQKKDDIEECIYRLEKLCSPNQNFFFGKSTTSILQLASSGLVCVDLHSLPSEQSRSLAGLTILQFIIELMRSQPTQEDKIRLFVVLDEAWKIAQDEKSDAVSLIREGRKYGFSLIVASQNPTDISKTILSNAGTIFIFRLLLHEYKDYVRSSLAYSDEIAKQISTFNVGSAAVHLIRKEKTTSSTTFIIKKIDGEEPFVLLSLRGDGMKFEFEKEELRRKLHLFGLQDEQVSEILLRFSLSGNTIPAQELVSLLEKYGFARTRILSLFRELGAPEASLLSLFSTLQRSRLGADADKLATLTLDGD